MVTAQKPESGCRNHPALLRHRADQVGSLLPMPCRTSSSGSYLAGSCSQKTVTYLSPANACPASTRVHNSLSRDGIASVCAESLASSARLPVFHTRHQTRSTSRQSATPASSTSKTTRPACLGTIAANTLRSFVSLDGRRKRVFARASTLFASCGEQFMAADR